MMKNSPYLFYVILFIIIISMSYTKDSYSQTKPLSYKYNVKIGDSNTYIETKAINLQNNSFEDYFLLENQSYVRFNLTQGVTYKITVNTINETANNIKKVFITIILTISGRGTYMSPVGDGSGFIRPSFDNLTEAKYYYNIAFSKLVNPKFTIRGDLISLTSSITSNNITTSSLQVFNLRSGWLEKFDSKIASTNGTVLLEYQLQRESTGLLETFFNYVVIGLEISSVGVFIILIVFLVFKYKIGKSN